MKDKRSLVSWALYDWAQSPFSAVIQTFVFAAYFVRRVSPDDIVGSAQWGNAIGISGIFIALIGPIFGAIADQTGKRKPWILLFTIIGIIAIGFMWCVHPNSNDVLLGLLLICIGTIATEVAFIFYNAMLPSISPPGKIGYWSGIGWAYGYAGGVVCLIISLVIFINNGPSWFGFDMESGEHIRATFVFVAIWFLIFSVPIFLYTPDEPPTGLPFSKAVSKGMKQLWNSLKNIRKYRYIVRFLIARMAYIDGLATIFAFGGVYAASSFDMNEKEVIIFGIGLNITAAIGSLLFTKLDDKIGSKKVILISLVGLMIPFITILNIYDKTLFWFFGLLIGIFVGPIQASSRSYLAKIVPKHLENEMFGFFAFSGKATSFLGPLMVGWFTYLYKSPRIGMSTIFIFFIIGGLIMLTVPEAKPKN